MTNADSLWITLNLDPQLARRNNRLLENPSCTSWSVGLSAGPGEIARPSRRPSVSYHDIHQVALDALILAVLWRLDARDAGGQQLRCSTATGTLPTPISRIQRSTSLTEAIAANDRFPRKRRMGRTSGALVGGIAVRLSRYLRRLAPPQAGEIPTMRLKQRLAEGRLRLIADLKRNSADLAGTFGEPTRCKGRMRQFIRYCMGVWPTSAANRFGEHGTRHARFPRQHLERPCRFWLALVQSGQGPTDTGVAQAGQPAGLPLRQRLDVPPNCFNEE